MLVTRGLAAKHEPLRHARRTTEIVFQHAKLTVAISYQVDARDVALDPLMWLETDTRSP